MYTPPVGSSPTSSPQRTRSEPSASLLQMVDAAHRDAAAERQNDRAGSGGEGSTRGGGGRTAVQDGIDGGRGAGKAAADGNAGGLQCSQQLQASSRSLNSAEGCI